MAVNAPGVRSVLETTDVAKQKNLAIVSGLCYRYDPPKVELIKHVRDGAIGDMVAMQVSYNTGTLWHHGREPSWSEMEYQLRNWLYFNWLSGDFNVEQHIHSLDKAAWAMGDVPPLKASGLGGRQVRVEEKSGNIYDHFSVVYEYAGGVKLFAQCRQMDGCTTDVSDHLMGTKGSAEMMRAEIEGQNPWRYAGAKPNMYEEEHRASSPASAAAVHQQRHLHGPQHNARHHGPHGHLHRQNANLGPVPQFHRNARPTQLRMGPRAPGARSQARADAVRVRDEH